MSTLSSKTNPLANLSEAKIAEYIGYTPNSWQAKVRLSDAQFMFLCIGRRAGKTFFATQDTKHGLVSDLFKPNQHVWVVAPKYRDTLYIWEPLVRLARTKLKPLIYRITNTEGSQRIETKLGTIIEAKSAKDPTALVGAGLTKIVVDEAASIDERAWYQAMMPALTTKHGMGKAVFIGTPRGKNWFYYEFMKGMGKDPDPDYFSFTAPTMSNEYLPKDAIEKLTRNMPELKYRQEILAEFIDDGGMVFRGLEAIKHGTPQGPVDGHEYSMGVDLAKSVDFTVITIIDRATHQVVYQDRFNQLDWGFQKSKIMAAAQNYNHAFITIDSTGLGDPITDDIRRAGFAVDDYKYTNQSKAQLIEKLAIFIEQKNISIPKVYEEAFHELEVFSFDQTPLGNIRYNAPGGFHDDIVNSLALAVWPLVEPVAPVKFDEYQENYAFISEQF